MREANAPKPRLLDRAREALRVRHYSRRTDEAYAAWIRRYVLFHGKRHPAELSGLEVTRSLKALAVEGRVAASTQNQALSALPRALARKYAHASRQWVFPATRIYVDRASGQRRRHHLNETVLQREVKRALVQAGVPKRASLHTL